MAKIKPRNPEFPVTLYAYDDPREPGHLRYIGQTTSPAHRHVTHRQRATRPQCYDTAFAQWFRRLLKEGIEPRQRFLGQVSVSKADVAEQRLIASYRALGFDLLNATKGGVGAPGFCPTIEQRKRMSVAGLGKPKSLAHSEAISQGSRGKTKSIEHRRSLSAAWARWRVLNHSRILWQS